MSKQPTIKRKILEMKDKAQFAAQYGLSKSSFGSILNQHQSLKVAAEEGKTIEGRKKSRKDPLTK